MNQRQQYILNILKCFNIPIDIIKSILPYDYYFLGKCNLIMDDSKSHISSISILSDGRIVSGSRNKRIKIW